MEAILTWVNAHWYVWIIVIGLLIRVINVTTKHWSDKAGLMRWCYWALDILDVLKYLVTTTPKPGGDK